jgi:hypothetical protein
VTGHEQVGLTGSRHEWKTLAAWSSKASCMPRKWAATGFTTSTGITSAPVAVLLAGLRLEVWERLRMKLGRPPTLELREITTLRNEQSRVRKLHAEACPGPLAKAVLMPRTRLCDRG